MNFNKYQAEARKTAIYPNLGDNLVYPVLGLCGEAGEVAEKVKKVMRDKGGLWDKESRQKLAEELGDVLWYVANIAYELDLPLGHIAKKNIDKLKSRQERGKLQGDGDDR